MLEKLRHRVVSRIASRHVAGNKLQDALKICAWANSRGYNYILSAWQNGELTELSEEDKNKNMESFISALTSVKKNSGNAYLSIKLDALGYDYALFYELLEMAKAARVRLHIDSLAPDSCDTNFRFLEDTSDYHDFLGCTLPSRWKRSLDDADKAIDLGLSVRLVKGQWEDPFNKIDSRDNYLALAEKLAGKVPYIGIATHDKKLAVQTIQLLKGKQDHFELEQFFSLPLNGISLAKKYSVPYRLYISYGHPAIPYNYRFAMTRPALGVWMISDFAFHFKKPWAGNGLAN